VITEKRWGVRAIDVRAVINEGRWLFYMRDGKKTIIHRVYNRLIPDDVERLGLELPFDYRDDLEVEWTGSPEWYLPDQQVLTSPISPTRGYRRHVPFGAQPGFRSWRSELAAEAALLLRGRRHRFRPD
jgi:hypothetical protein